MTTPTSNQSTSKEAWPSLTPYIVSPAAASAAIIPSFYDMIAKSALQKGLPAPSLTLSNMFQGIKGGFGAAPTVGVMVGAQMGLQNLVKKALVKVFPDLFSGDSNQAKTSLTLASSVMVGALSSPALAIYNGKTMTPPWSMKESWSKFSSKQAGAITLQETGFVAGLAAADLVSVPMKQALGDSKSVEYTAAAVSGALGSLAGHAGNTALTRWQNGMTVDSVRQLGWGALRKARGNAIFGAVYKFCTEALTPSAKEKNGG